jgi:drug/metabolite transporter (DMT)-like permease
MLTLIGLQLLYGCSLPLNKYLLGFCAPVFFSGIRMLCAGIVLFGGYRYYNKSFPQFNKEQIFLFLQASFFGVYLKYILRNWSLSLLPPGKLAFMLYLTPFIAGICAGKATTKKQWIALCIGFIGLLPLIFLKTKIEQGLATWYAFSLPELAVFAAMFCHIIGMLSIQKLIKTHAYSGLYINMVRSLIGGLFALLTSFYMENFFPINLTLSFGAGFVLLILLSNIICHNLYFKLLKTYSVTFLLFTDFINPLVTAFYGWLFFKEVITWHYGLSALVMMLALYLFHQDELKHEQLVLTV